MFMYLLLALNSMIEDLFTSYLSLDSEAFFSHVQFGGCFLQVNYLCFLHPDFSEIFLSLFHAEKLRELAWSGVPPYMRPNIWRLLLVTS